MRNKVLNNVLDKSLDMLTKEDAASIVQELIARMQIEYEKSDRSGIYAKTQT